MKCSKSHQRQREVIRTESIVKNTIAVDQTISSPEILSYRLKQASGNNTRSSQSVSQSNLPAVEDVNKSEDTLRIEKISSPEGDLQCIPDNSGDMQAHGPNREFLSMLPYNNTARKQNSVKKCCRPNAPKKSRPCSPLNLDSDNSLSKRIRDIHNGTRKSARVIRDSRARLLELQKKTAITESDVKELYERNELLLREMDRFDRFTKTIQKLVGAEVAQLKKPKDSIETAQGNIEYIPGSIYESPVYHEMKMNHPTVLLASGRNVGSSDVVTCEPPPRSKSVRDRCRKIYIK